VSGGSGSILETEFGVSGARQYAGILQAVAHGLEAAASPLPSVMTVTQVAEDMQTTESTVRRMIRAGEIPTIETHVDFLRIPRAGYLAFLEASKVKAGSSLTDCGVAVCAANADVIRQTLNGHVGTNPQETQYLSATNEYSSIEDDSRKSRRCG